MALASQAAETEWLLGVVAALCLAGAALLSTLPRYLVGALYGEPPERRVPWALLDLLLVALVGFLGLVAVGGVLALVGPGEPRVVFDLAAMVIALAPAVVCAAQLARRRGGSAARGLGLVGLFDPRAVLAAGAAYPCFVPIFLGVAGAWRVGLDMLGREPQPQDVVVAIAGIHGPWLAAAGCLAVLVVPALEELLFRGFLQPLLSRPLGAGGGILASSTVFAALHGLDAFVPILALSLLLGWLRWRTGSLAAPWIVHALHNGLTLALLMLVPEAREIILEGEACLP